MVKSRSCPDLGVGPAVLQLSKQGAEAVEARWAEVVQKALKANLL